MLTKRFSLLFRLRKPSKYSKGNMHVYMRITIDSDRIELSTNREFDPARWNSKIGRPTGTKEDAKALNAYLEMMQVKVYEAHREILASSQIPTVAKIKNILQGRDAVPCRLLLETFQDHNNNMEKLIKKEEYAQGTLTHFQTTLRHLKTFLKQKYQTNDMSIERIDFSFISDFEFYLKSQICAHNTAMKYLGDLKKVILLCIKHRWILKDPFLGYKMTRRDVQKDFLVDQELQALTDKKFFTERLSIVRDIFLFSCYTGLAYADVNKLKRSEIRVGIDSKKWLFIQRQKTETPSPVPLLPIAITLLDKYKDHPKCIKQDKVLPILTNQKMNEYLKEIAEVCGVEKELTYHTARHTFGTTVTLNNNVPIESVSKMMGHKNLKTTQHYAKILNKKVGEDMEALAKKLNNG